MQTYMVGEVEFAFDNVAFDRLVKRDGRVGVVMARLASSCNFSAPALKDWRFGMSSPSDIEKVDSIAGYFGVERSYLLKQVKGDAAMNTLNEAQKESYARLYAEITNFFAVADENQMFIWTDYDLDRFPASIAYDIVPSAVSLDDPSLTGKLIHGSRGVRADDLHNQLVERARRALTRERCWLGHTAAYTELEEFIERYLDGYAYAVTEGHEVWMPDPGMLFEPDFDANGNPVRPQCYMRDVELEAAEKLEEMTARSMGW